MSESISVSVSEQATVSGAACNSSGRIYWVGGSKGGVGKSMMTLATVDHLLEQRANVLLVECDTSNPDVWKAFKDQVGDGAHRPRRGGRLDTPRQHVRPSPR